MYVYCNPNPHGRNVGDCAVRALCIVTGKDWYDIQFDLTAVGAAFGDMANSNDVWGEYAKLYGFKRYLIPDTCPSCYTVADFANDHKEGTYLLGTGSHVVAVIDGNYIDAWDSGKEVPFYFWKKEQ